MELFKLLGTIAIDNSKANKDIEDTTGKASDSSGKMSRAFKMVGAAVGTFFAVDKIKDFGLGCVSAAADMSAMSSQFSQVFGDMEGKASNALGKIADSAGINENRMKGSFTKIAAFAKTSGMDTESALGLSERAMIAVADSAAFYDRSLEDTTESLQSFLKGNFENDAALGLSCTETTRNTAANKLYGKSFNELSESQKQLTLLQMVEDANAASGALGQAARESDTWTNVTGNLKQAWTDFQATVGSNVLPLAVDVVKGMVGAVTNLSDKVPGIVERFTAFKDRAAELGGYIGETLKPIFDDAKAAFDAVRDAVQPIIDKFTGYVESGQAADDITTAIKTAVDGLATAYETAKGFVEDMVQGFQDAVTWGKEHENGLILIATATGTLTAAIVAYNVAAAIKKAGGIAEIAQLGILQVQIWALTAAETAHTAVTTIATAATTAFGAVLSFVTSPITLVIAAIGALIAIGVLLYKNWDVIKEKCAELWSNVTEKFSALKENVSAKVEEMKAAVREKFDAIKSAASEKFNAVKNTVKNVMQAAKDTVDEKLTNMKNAYNEHGGGIKGIAAAAMEGVKGYYSAGFTFVDNLTGGKLSAVASKFKSKMEEAKSAVSEKLSGIKSSFTNGLSNAYNTVVSKFNSIKTKISSVMESAKSIVTGAISTLKNAFNFSWSLPHIKLPHFKVTGGKAPWGFMGEGSLPSVSVSWYRKAMDNAMILDDPTIFGMNQKTGELMGAGEAGNEVVAGEAHLLNLIQGAVATQNSGLLAVLQNILEAILAMDENMGGNLREALDGTSFVVNKREFARLVKGVT